MTNEAVKKKNSFKPKSVLSKPVITTRMLVSIALCSAIAYVLMLIEIAIPIVPSFVKFDFSDLPALICAFTFGPLAGVFSAFINNPYNGCWRIIKFYSRLLSSYTCRHYLQKKQNPKRSFNRHACRNDLFCGNGIFL